MCTVNFQFVKVRKEPMRQNARNKKLMHNFHTFIQIPTLFIIFVYYNIFGIGSRKANV